jgi:hypothetical protein
MEDICTWDEETALMNLVKASIVKRYDGPLERQGTFCQGEVFFTPVDHDQCIELLEVLWGEFLKEDTLNNVFLLLVMDGAEEWPHGYEYVEEAVGKANRATESARIQT